MEQVGGGEQTAVPAGVGSNLAKLRAILDLARTLQSSFSIDDVLVSVVDTALTITGAERGFLLLRAGGGGTGDACGAATGAGRTCARADLRVPREVIRRALEHRRELLSMNFDPLGADETRPQNSIADLELRSVICVPLVRIRAGQNDATSVLVTGNETVGVLYMDSRVIAADLAGGNRELLQTLAIEASTVLENARLLQEEQAKHQMEEELRLARTIQQSLLPQQSAGRRLAAGQRQQRGVAPGGRRLLRCDASRARTAGAPWWRMFRERASARRCWRRCCRARCSPRPSIRRRWGTAWSGSITSCWIAPAAKSMRPCSIPCCTRTGGCTTSTRRIARRWWCARTASVANWRPAACRSG